MTYVWTPVSFGKTADPDQINALGAQVQGLSIRAANKDFLNSVGGCSLTTTSATYVDITGASKAFNKYGGASDSDFLITVNLAMYSATNPSTVKIGVNINGSDYDVIIHSYNTANSHMPVPQGCVRITGLAAGVYTVKLRALRVSGTGTLNIDSNDNVLIICEEVAK